MMCTPDEGGLGGIGAGQQTESFGVHGQAVPRQHPWIGVVRQTRPAHPGISTMFKDFAGI